MTAPDPLDDLLAPLRSPAAVDPDPAFAARLRARVERALLDPPDRAPTTSTRENTVTTTATTTEPVTTLHTVTPYLAVRDAREALAFYVAAFDAVPRGEPIVMPDGRIGHAEVAVGDSVLMLAEEFPEMGLLAPTSRGGPSQSLRLEVDDPDAVVDRALAAGARLDRPVTGSPHGRSGAVLDPSGHRWMVSREARTGNAPPPRPGEVVHASVWTPDVDRAADFYAAVLGWAVEPDSDPDDRRVTNLPTPLRLHTDRRSTAFLCFAVPDVDAAVALVRAAGGTAGEPVDESGGRVADCVDDQGLPFALRSGRPGPVPDPTAAGAMTYLTVEVSDATRARAFYGTVLGWRFTPGRVEHGWGVTLAGGEETRPMTGLWGGRAGDPVVTPMYVVRDVAAAVAAVRARGGASTDPERQPYGTSAECTDDQGGRFYLVQY